MDGVIDFRETGRKGKHQHYGVEDGSGEEAVAAGCAADRLTEALAGREFLAIGTAELDACDESTLADLVDEGLAGFQGGKTGGEVGNFFGESF